VAVADIYVLDFVINIGMCTGCDVHWMRCAPHADAVQLSLLVGRLSWTHYQSRSSNWAQLGVRTIPTSHEQNGKLIGSRQ